MQLTRLRARGFRNLEPLDLWTDTRFVALHGDNAQGKTNVLEAIWVLATLKPLRARRNRELIQWGAERADLLGDIRAHGVSRTHGVLIEPGRRRPMLDGKTAELSRYFEGIRAISFRPQDVAVVQGEPARRRTWLDRAAFTAWPVHLEAVRTYRRCLVQKGAALKEDPRSELLDVLDAQLAEAGARVVQKRVALLDDLAAHVARMHTHIAGSPGALRLRYRTAAVGAHVPERARALATELERVRPRELQRRIPLAGPQTDELEILLEDRLLRTYGSQGQVRSAVLALKLAELLAARERGDLPLFLLDDVGSELDRQRTARLVGTLDELGAQVFATSTHKTHLAALPEADTCWIGVEAGTLVPS